MSASILQAHWSNPATAVSEESYWQDSFLANTTPGSTIVQFSLLSNYDGHYCQIAQNGPDGSPAVTGDPVNGAYTQLVNFNTPVGTENYAMNVFYNASSVSTSQMLTQNYNGGDDGVAMCIVEVGGVSTSPLAGYSHNYQNVTGSGTGNISSANTSGSLGTSPIIMIAFSTGDNNVILPATDTSGGFTNFSNGITWSDYGGGPFANLSYKLFANPGTTPALFSSTATDEYATMMIALLQTGPATPIILTSRPYVAIEQTIFL
jgi:hypothetical protein